METRLASWMQHTPQGRAADAILRSCVHCGFCLATCPTYQVLGDENDSPRGRIYQIKQVLEGTAPTRLTQLHLDRCLTCRGCETTCPSGVAYGRLVDIGRSVVDARVKRPWRERCYRWILREGLTHRWMFGAALRCARWISWVLPGSLRAKVGMRRPAGKWPSTPRARKVLLVDGCTQPAIAPSIDAATARVLDRMGVQAVVAHGSGCCGAIRHHLGDETGARRDARRNIDAWWPYIVSGKAEALLINASGCGAMVREYAYLLRDDAVYAAKARRVIEATRDLAEFLPAGLTTLRSASVARAAPRIAFHCPCTLQHGFAGRADVEKVLTAFGAKLVPVADRHLCCGSAGTYSILQARIATVLRERKLANLIRERPDVILSANVGCIAHLQSGTDVPVRHWIEWIDAALAQRQVA